MSLNPLQAATRGRIRTGAANGVLVLAVSGLLGFGVAEQPPSGGVWNNVRHTRQYAKRDFAATFDATRLSLQSGVIRIGETTATRMAGVRLGITSGDVRIADHQQWNIDGRSLTLRSRLQIDIARSDVVMPASVGLVTGFLTADELHAAQVIPVNLEARTGNVEFTFERQPVTVRRRGRVAPNDRGFPSYNDQRAIIKIARNIDPVILEFFNVDV